MITLQQLFEKAGTITRKHESCLRLINELMTYAHLPDNWDGYGAAPISRESIMDVFCFLEKFPSELTLPKSMAGSDGKVGLFWEKGDAYCSLDFDGDGKYIFIADTNESETGGEFRVTDALPPSFLNFIGKYFSDILLQ